MRYEKVNVELASRCGYRIFYRHSTKTYVVWPYDCSKWLFAGTPKEVYNYLRPIARKRLFG